MRRPRCPGRVARPGCVCSPSPGSPAPSARSAPRPGHPRAAVPSWEDRSTASGPAADASPAGWPASPGGPSAPPGAAGPRRRAPPGQPSAASAAGSAAAARRLRGAAPQLGVLPVSGRTSRRASVPSQARNVASRTTSTAGKPAGQPPMPRFGTPQAPCAWGVPAAALLPGYRVRDLDEDAYGLHLYHIVQHAAIECFS
jgi:hypothetical protein